jgi:hypothetical protein
MARVVGINHLAFVTASLNRAIRELAAAAQADRTFDVQS